MSHLSSTHDALPTQASDRLVVLDALRGFALLGIMFVNYTWFTGFAVIYAATPERLEALGTLKIDTAVNYLVVLLIDSKFWSIFALLFGVGLGMQLARLTGLQRGVQHLRGRLIVLLLVGLAHGSLVWFGDIISLYALTGFALLLFGCVSTRALLRCGLFFLAIPVLQSAIWLMIYGQLHHSGKAPPDFGHGPAELLPHFASGSVWQVFEANWAFLVQRWVRALWEGRLFKLLGMFLVGYWAVRQRIYENSAANRKLLRRVMVVSFLIGIPSNWVYAQTGGGIILPLNAAEFMLTINQCVGIPALACGYAAAFLLVYWTRPDLEFWNYSALTGRLSLTNYIMQSVIGVGVFYGCGLGMWGRIGISGSLAVIAIVFLAQSVFSRWWLSAFRYGPLEWVCRCLVYRTLLPLRRRHNLGHSLAVSE